MYQPAEQQILSIFDPLFTNSGEQVFPEYRPFLAHYTSISTVESILKKKEVWFSNPLLMNDWEELRFGMNEGKKQFFEHAGICDALEPERLKILHDTFSLYYNQFDNQHALDVYVFCLSHHNPKNSDGSLSMWRGYGADGAGAAIVFDTAKLNNLPNSALRIGKVEYASVEKRRALLSNILETFSNCLKSIEIPNTYLGLASWVLFQRIKLFALYTKHDGFAAEEEWRVVYLKEFDANGDFDSMIDYAIGRNGVEPKLKLSLNEKHGLQEVGVPITEMIGQLILGPSLSTPLAKASFERMLDKNDLSSLKSKVVVSTIPFRTVK